jgi:hypothetical protein
MTPHKIAVVKTDRGVMDLSLDGDTDGTAHTSLAAAEVAANTYGIQSTIADGISEEERFMDRLQRVVNFSSSLIILVIASRHEAYSPSLE